MVNPSLYDVVIERGKSPLNDQIIDKIKQNIPRKKLITSSDPSSISNKYLDVGCNTGWLLEEVPYGVGIDNSKIIVSQALAKGLDVICHDVTMGLPFPDNSFNCVVLSCVLQQVSEPLELLWDAMRVARHKVIGVSPYPGMSEWGRINGNKWTKSVIWPDKLKEMFYAKIEEIDNTHYFFEIRVRNHSKMYPFKRKINAKFPLTSN